MMADIFARQAIHPYCPAGGQFFACASKSLFVGCCNSDPCTNSCPDGNLTPASFDPAAYGTFGDQSCPTGSRWYTCTGTTPPFLGCCKSNPCANNGCAPGDLTAGFLSSNPNVAAPFLANTTSATSSSAPTSTSVTTSSAAATSTSTNGIPPIAQPAATPFPTPSSPPVGAIAGGAAGGVAALAIIIGLLVWYCRRKKAPPRAEMDDGNHTFYHDQPTYAAKQASDKGASNMSETGYSPNPGSQYGSTPLPAYQQYNGSPSQGYSPHSPALHSQPSYELSSATVAPSLHELPSMPVSKSRPSGLNIVNAHHQPP